MDDVPDDPAPDVEPDWLLEVELDVEVDPDGEVEPDAELEPVLEPDPAGLLDADDPLPADVFPDVPVPLADD